ncbi:MAG: hypothetical protein LBK61_08850 [Spirochaetaceae bacterium]|nr:hypothetical protein [Spirochaetaceae bacterium]
MKIKRRHAPFAFSLFLVFFFALSCSSLPSIPDMQIPAETESPTEAESPAETVNPPDDPPDLTDEVFLPETAMDEDLEADETDDDIPEIWRRAEEMLAYLESPLNLDLPEPVYVIPEPEPVVAEAEPLSEDEPAEPLESIEPAVEVADATGDEEEDSGPEEDVAEEPPPVPPSPPVVLRPVREVAAVPPPREPVSVPPSPLPALPARVPPNETKPQNDATTPTRTVQATLGENAEIPLPGSGWVYLGEVDDQSGLAYRQRRASAEGQVFVFRPESIGSYRLKFTKQDLLRGTETSEIVEVAVVEKNTPEESAAVPSTAPTVAPPVETETAPPEPPSPPLMAEAADTAPPVAFATAITDDTALWNRGQELEAPGPNRDMKGALAAYKSLVQDYPQSGYYTDSQKRIAYIERFFVNIH